MTSVHCGQCDTLLNESPSTPVDKRHPCPNCGSASRRYNVASQGEITPHGQLRYRAREGGKGKAFVEGLVGADWSHRLQRWLRKFRLIDRRTNRYQEIVADPKTGEILHETDEPLTKHRGHGSDKPAK